MRWLINSAVIPSGAFGTWTYSPVTRGEAAEFLRAGGWTSRIGYPATAMFLAELAPGVEIPLSREESKMQPGDEALVARLKYRLQDPALKRDWKPSDEDFELGILRYEKEA